MVIVLPHEPASTAAIATAATAAADPAAVAAYEAQLGHYRTHYNAKYEGIRKSGLGFWQPSERQATTLGHVTVHAGSKKVAERHLWTGPTPFGPAGNIDLRDHVPIGRGKFAANANGLPASYTAEAHWTRGTVGEANEGKWRLHKLCASIFARATKCALTLSRSQPSDGVAQAA
jgi:hypothetical protein